MNKNIPVHSIKKIITKLINYNPLLTLSLGICSSLAVTNQISASIIMSLGICFTLVISSAVVSYLRFKIPTHFRLITFMIIIASNVIIYEKILRIILPALAHNLGAYVGLIITNCIILGHLESSAVRNNIYKAIYDAFLYSISFGCFLVLVAIIREFLGSGKLLEYSKFTGFSKIFEPAFLFIMPAGAYFVLTVVIYVANRLHKLSS